jgi:hypothetical protein
VSQSGSVRQPLAQHRDALVQELPSGKIKGIVAAAYLLTPFVPEFGETFAQTGMPSRLFHPVYRSSFRFGATIAAAWDVDTADRRRA